MNMPARLILMVVIVVAPTDSIEFIHIKGHPESLTIPWLIKVIVVIILPVAIIILYWHKRKWL